MATVEMKVLCFFIDPTIEAKPTSMEDVVAQIRDGRDGTIRRQGQMPRDANLLGRRC